MKKFNDLMSVSNEIENISASDAKKKLNDPNVQFIDVRDKESFSKSTIGNAINLDRGLLEFYLADGSPLENDTFKKNPDKFNYLYILTPKGVSEKTKLTISFMKRKMKEYDDLKKELNNSTKKIKDLKF